MLYFLEFVVSIFYFFKHDMHYRKSFRILGNAPIHMSHKLFTLRIRKYFTIILNFFKPLRIVVVYNWAILII